MRTLEAIGQNLEIKEYLEIKAHAGRGTPGPPIGIGAYS
jgi:hypothetical protein